MTYEEIISQASRRLGHVTFTGQAKADYRYAIKFVEEEILSSSGIVKNTKTKTLTSGTEKIKLPIDFGEPCELIFKDSDGNALANTGVPFETFKTSTAPTSESSDNDVIPLNESPQYIVDIARYSGRLIHSIIYSADSYWLYYYPHIDGSVDIIYTVVPNGDVWISLQETPSIPTQFHRLMIDGIVRYLAEIELGNAKSKGDVPSIQFYASLLGRATDRFDENKREVKEASDPNKIIAIAKPDVWYDTPTKYR